LTSILAFQARIGIVAGVTSATSTTASTVTADIVIVGGGPVGLMLACELRLCGADPVVLERLPGISPIPKGNGLVGQIVPVLDYRGLLDRFRAQATFAGPVPRFSFGPLELDFATHGGHGSMGARGSSPLHILAIPQRRLEELLGERLAELGGTIRRGHELIAVAQDEDAVTLDVQGPDGGYRLRARYLVGCDGAHSLVRKQAGIAFPGVTSTEIARIGRVLLPTAKITRGGREVKVPGVGRLKLMTQVPTPTGVYSLGPLAALDKNAQTGAYIVFTSEDDPSADLSTPMTLDDLRASFRRVLGADLPMTDPQLLTRLVGNSRLAERYRAGRILLAGDAAHVLGAGGSLNTGMLDAVNLGWKLAAEVQRRAPGGMLDSYQAERHLAGQHAILQTRAQKALTVIGRGGTAAVSAEGAEALRQLFGEIPDRLDPLGYIRDLLRQPERVRHIGELIEGSDVRYPMPPGAEQPHPLLGRLAPDLRLETSDGGIQVAELMRAARGVLLDFSPGSEVAAAASGWSRRIRVVAARSLPQPAPAAALLIRPDGYVAWASDPAAPDLTAGLNEALRTWFSPPAPPPS
jgi:2-polyprenyl-6-methoxyphenol hydroxylase-like FAD-dependent oxidoreductase